jgi:hypothetical protein
MCLERQLRRPTSKEIRGTFPVRERRSHNTFQPKPCCGHVGLGTEIFDGSFVSDRWRTLNQKQLTYAGSGYQPSRDLSTHLLTRWLGSARQPWAISCFPVPRICLNFWRELFRTKPYDRQNLRAYCRNMPNLSSVIGRLLWIFFALSTVEYLCLAQQPIYG